MNSCSNGRGSANLEKGESLPQILVDDLEDLSSYICDLMAAMPIPVYAVNSAGIIIDGNRALAEFTGYPLEELLGKSSYSIFADEAEAKNIEREMVVKGYIKEGELTLRTKDGGKIPVNISIRTRADESGNVSYVAALMDITMQKEAKKRMEEVESSILNAIPHAVIGVHKRHIFFANRGVETVFGWKPEELIGKTTRVLYRTDEEDEEIASHFYPVLEGQQTYSEEFPCRRKDGRDIICFVSTARIGGKLEERRIVATFEDITERKRTEEEIEIQRIRFRSIFDHSLEGIVILDINNNILDANLGFENIFGYKVEEIKGRYLDDLVVPERLIAGEAKELDRMALGGILGYETIRKRKSGAELNVSISAGPTKIGGEAEGRFVIFRDIAERKRAEEEIQKSRDELEMKVKERTAQLARAREDEYRQLAEDMNDGYFIVRYNQVIFANNKYAELLGYELDEVIGKPFIQHVAPEFEAMVNTLPAKRMRGEPAPETYEVSMVRKDGTNFPAEFSARLIQFQGHRATSTVVRDITERRKSEKVLQESEEKYCSFFATSMDCVFITSRDGRWIDMNDAAVEFFGYESRDDLQKVRIPELYENPEEREKHTRVIEQQGFSKEFAVNLRKKDGSIVNALITSVARRDENGNIIGFQGTIRDITERRRVEEALRESEGNLRALFDAVLDGILMLDYSGEVLALNSALAKMFDLESANKAVGRNVLEFILPEFHDAVIKDLASVKEGRGGYLNSYKVRGISGKEFWVEGLGTDITYKGEHVNLVSVRDITERKRAEEQLERSFVDLAETVSRSMGTRDPYTASHQRRVAELARLVGEKMGLDGNRLMGLYIGGLLRDIGKISTPEAILSKPGKLTEEEWALIRAHAKQGYEILKDTDLPWPVADMALHHHERLDGSGYPHGISGDEISLENRILSVCDVVEAMSSHRPYRPARSREEVLEEIKGGRGTKYDANVVDVMLEIIESGEFDSG